MPQSTLDIAPDQTMVVVRLVKDTQTQKVQIEVAVRSCAARGRWSDVKLDPDDARLEYLVEQAAEFLACHQCARYGDKHNPPEVAKKALEALRDLMKAAERARTRPDAGKTSADEAFGT